MGFLVMHEKFNTYKIDLDYAEIAIGIKDGLLELETPGTIDIATFKKEFLDSNLRKGDIRFGVEITPMYIFPTGNIDNYEGRFIKITSRVSSCTYEGNLSENAFISVWKDCFIMFVEKLMSYLGQKEAQIRFYHRKDVTKNDYDIDFVRIEKEYSF